MPHEEEAIICPNCGYAAVDNYCARCGQKNHLHKDTLWGLLLHFFEHYFHYDNKFWQTMRALFKPGKLTVAYWKNQRMRYISPISLYIFISAVHFIVTHFIFSLNEKKVLASLKNGTLIEAKASPTQNSAQPKTAWLPWVLQKIKANPEKIKPVVENIQHFTPRVFFFMVPFTAALLTLLFIRRKEFYFVDHIIFSLHLHSFYFILMLASSWLVLFPYMQVIVSLASFVLLFLYFTRSVKNAYKISAARAAGCTFAAGLVYAVTYVAIIGSYLYIQLKEIYGT